MNALAQLLDSAVESRVVPVRSSSDLEERLADACSTDIARYSEKPYIFFLT